MKKNIIIKLLTIILVSGIGTSVYADTQANLVFKTNVPKATKIEKVSTSTPVYANPETGTISGTLSSIFELNSNDTENSNEFVITSSVETSTGTISAYDYWGNIAFTNSESLPTSVQVNEALTHTGDNPNVIVYPVTITASPFTSTFQPGYKTFGYCYRINLNGETEGTITHSVNPTPVSGTFHKTKDTSGLYKTTITITSVGL